VPVVTIARELLHHCAMEIPSPERPNWYGTPLVREDRSWFSATGDRDVLAGKTFPTTYATYMDAAHAAQRASEGPRGAVMVMRPESAGRYYLVRAYEPVWNGRAGYHIAQAAIDGHERLGSWHPAAKLIVDGDVSLRPGAGQVG
jgi:hypothetical protein